MKRCSNQRAVGPFVSRTKPTLSASFFFHFFPFISCPQKSLFIYTVFSFFFKCSEIYFFQFFLQLFLSFFYQFVELEEGTMSRSRFLELSTYFNQICSCVQSNWWGHFLDYFLLLQIQLQMTTPKPRMKNIKKYILCRNQ